MDAHRKGEPMRPIDADALIEFCAERWIPLNIDAVNMQPTIQPERKKGEWLPDNNNAYEMRFVCSCCKESEVVPTISGYKIQTAMGFLPELRG